MAGQTIYNTANLENYPVDAPLTHDAMLQYIFEQQYDPDYCTNCGNTTYHKTTERSRYVCRNKKCRKTISPQSSTIFRYSWTPLPKWWLVFQLYRVFGDELTGYQVSRSLKVTKATGGSILGKVKQAMHAKAP